MIEKLNKRIEHLWASQYHKSEYSPNWYKMILRFSPTREDVASELVKNSKGRLLDIGCGDGNFLINNSYDFRQLVGIDLVDYRIKRAQKNINKKGIKNIKVATANIEDGLKFSKRSFDVVVCLGVIEYTFDPEFVVNQVNNILKNEGLFILEVPNIGFLFERLKLLFGGLPNVAPAKGWQGGRLHNFTRNSLSELLEEQGFVIDKVMGSGFLNRIRSIWPSLLSGDLIFVCRKK